MTMDFMNLVSAFFLCNAEAEVRVLNQYEAQRCLGYQTAIKIELLEDVDAETYAGMTTAERAAFGQRGYQAYLDWKAAHPELVEALQMQARVIAAHTTS